MARGVNKVILVGNLGQKPEIRYTQSDSAVAKVQTVTVDVTTAFDGSAPTLTIGDAGDNDRLMTNDYIDLKDVATYEVTPNYTYTNAADTDV